MRRVGTLLPAAADDPEFRARLGGFLQGLEQLGWSVGRNIEIDYRWTQGNPNDLRRYAAEFAALAPDVILADGGAIVGALLQATRTVPIVFPVISDPVAAGLVVSLPRPGGNATGFMNFEYSIGGKWLGFLKEVAPNVTRVAVLRDATLASGAGQFAIMQAEASSLGIEVTPLNVGDRSEIERTLPAFAHAGSGGLIVTANPHAIVHRELIVGLAGHHKLPAVYFERFFATAGGLISYGPDIVDQYRRAAGYVDRI